MSLAVRTPSILSAIGTWTHTALVLPEGLTFDEWGDIGQKLQCAERSVMWWLGDWVRYGEQKWGESYSQAIDETGYSYSTIANATSVCGKFQVSRRRETCSFGHHAEVAALAPEVADALLDQAEQQGWSVRELRQEKNQLRNCIGALPSQDTCTASALESIIASGVRFGAVYADPPWKYDNQGTRAATGNHYDTLTVDEIAALPVRELVADDAHLHLWTTSTFLRDSFAIIDAWGFEYKSSFVWVKPQLGIGNYWRLAHEFLLTATRGKAPFRDRSLKSWLQCGRGKHSRKPDQVRRFIERASPPPFLELFGRESFDGWTVWGNEIKLHMLNEGVRELSRLPG